MIETPTRNATDFASTYRRLVLPILARHSQHLATDVADNTITFAQALARLNRLAYQRGAAYLPDHVRDDLHNHLASALANDTTRADAAQRLVQNLLREPSRAKIRQRIRGFING